MSALTYTAYYPSPIGLLEVVTNNAAVLQVNFFKEGAEQKPSPVSEHPAVLHQCLTELEEYFSGKRKQFTVPLAPEGTPFQLQVWATLQQIEFGKPISYLQQSKKLGNAKAIRAMASANGKNPVVIIIPCHRVIGTDQSLVGFGGGLWRKKWLLEHEAKIGNGVITLF